ncbi:MAG: hypothetical protein AAF221_13645 [Pseudomonadota bacterium]
MKQTELHVAKTLRQCVAYVVQDCDEAGFHEASYHLRRAMEELDKLDNSQPVGAAAHG